MMNESPVILFDGICNFCNGAVNFIIQRDKMLTIKFAALQSEAGRKILRRFDLPTDELSSVIFIEDGNVYTQSSAALKVCKYLTGLWPLMYGFIIVPVFIRDGIYKWIAKNRYKWFGKKEHCTLPTPAVRSRFLQ